MSNEVMKLHLPDGTDFEGTVEQLKELQALGVIRGDAKKKEERAASPAPVKPVQPHSSTSGQKPSVKWKQWSKEEDAKLKVFWEDPASHYASGETRGVALRRIARQLGRTPAAVSTRLCAAGISKKHVPGRAHKHPKQAVAPKQVVVVQHTAPVRHLSPAAENLKAQSLIKDTVTRLGSMQTFESRAALADSVMALLEGQKVPISGQPVTRNSVIATISYVCNQAKDGKIPYYVAGDGLKGRQFRLTPKKAAPVKPVPPQTSHPVKEEKKEEGYMLKKHPTIPKSFDKERLDLAAASIHKAGGHVPVPKIFPVFTSIKVDSRITEGVFSNLTGKEGNRLTYQDAAYVLGIDDIKQWHEFVIEAIRHSEPLCLFFGRKNLLRSVNGNMLVYGDVVQ